MNAKIEENPVYRLVITAKQVAAVFPTMAKGDVRYYLNGVCFTDTDIVTTDGHQLTRVKHGGQFGEWPAPMVIAFTKDAIAAIRKVSNADSELMVEIFDGQRPIGQNNPNLNRVRVTIGVSTIFECSTIDGTYPNYERVIPKGNKRVNRGQAFSAEYLGTLGAIAKAMRWEFSPAKLSQDDDTGALRVDLPDDITVVIMGMRDGK